MSQWPATKANKDVATNGPVERDKLAINVCHGLQLCRYDQLLQVAKQLFIASRKISCCKLVGRSLFLSNHPVRQT